MNVPRLRATRLRRMLTQEELAERAGVSLSTVARMERGKPGRISVIRKLAAALEAQAIELTGEDKSA